MEIQTYGQLLQYLEHEAVNHIAYYHYTRWECLRKMLEDADYGNGARHKFLLLTRAAKTNDGIEEKWSKNYFIACFSLSRYEDVAMWLNYGKRQPDSVRIKITRDAMDEWLAIRQHDVFAASTAEHEFVFAQDISDKVKSVKLYGLAYVIPSQHWITAKDEILLSPNSSDHVVQDGNIEIGRRFFKVAKDGNYNWVDAIYNAEDLSRLGIPPVFKKRGWAYEREIRLVVELKEDVNVIGNHIAIAFDIPFNELKRHMSMSDEMRLKTLLNGKMTPKTNIGDKRFPMVQSSPWYDGRAGSEAIAGFRLCDAIPSEYRDEIRMIFPGDAGCAEGER